MDYGVYLSASGFLNKQKQLPVIANNLANVNTAGYKGDIPVFRIPGASGTKREDVGSAPGFVALPRVETDFSQGSLMKTGNPLDVAIVGEGFFEIQTPQGMRYTRKGDFTLTSDGSLITQGGHPVMGEGGPIALPGGEIEINQDGLVFVDQEEQGQLRVVAFPENGNLIKEGEALFVWGGDPSQAMTIDDTNLKQGYLESSNVNPIREMVQMIEAIRTFEDHQKMIHAFDSAQRSAVNDIGRLR